jgi:hypothetical protein
MEIKKHKRECSLCVHFHFNWNNYWCDAGEKWICTAVKGIGWMEYAAGKDTCDKYIAGFGHNHEY